MNAFVTAPSTRIFRVADTTIETGMSRSTLYLRIADGTFTTPVQLGSRLVGWPASEVHAINKARIAGKSEDDIRALVVALEQARAC
jgi:prophage regulatory protein